MRRLLFSLQRPPGEEKTHSTNSCTAVGTLRPYLTEVLYWVFVWRVIINFTEIKTEGYSHSSNMAVGGVVRLTCCTRRVRWSQWSLVCSRARTHDSTDTHIPYTTPTALYTHLPCIFLACWLSSHRSWWRLGQGGRTPPPTITQPITRTVLHRNPLPLLVSRANTFPASYIPGISHYLTHAYHRLSSNAIPWRMAR